MYPCFWHYNRWEEDDQDIDDEEDYYYEGIPVWQPKDAYKYSKTTFIHSAKKLKFVFFWKPNAEVVDESCKLGGKAARCCGRLPSLPLLAVARPDDAQRLERATARHAILIATGNDWRAIEAGAHAFASRDGRYQGLSQWTLDMEREELVDVSV